MPKAEAVRQLVCAAESGDVDATRKILRKNSDAAHDWRPIMGASYKGFAPVVEILVEFGADVNAISSSEHNRLSIEPSNKGHLDVVDILLRSGADIEARST